MRVAAYEEDTLDASSDAEDQNQHLIFRLKDETYAVGILAVKEILEFGAITAVPMMPAHLRGVLNLRGRVVPVIDLAMLFSGEACEVNRRTCIIIIEVGADDSRQDIGVIVDAVSQVVEIPPNDIEPPPSFGSKLNTDFIAGLFKIDGRFTILLDIERALSVDELAAVVAGAEI